MKLEDVIWSLNTGLNPRQFFRLNTEDATNYYVTIREIRNNTIIFSDKTDKINDEALRLCNNRSNLEKGDILYSGTGTIGETAFIWETPNNWNIKEGVYAIKPKAFLINSKYLLNVLHTTYVKKQIEKNLSRGNVDSIPMGKFIKTIIPLPCLEEQQRIVSILDRFDTLCNDISSGIPAEIEARKKQYEYYRDKLLSFKPLE